MQEMLYTSNTQCYTTCTYMYTLGETLLHYTKSLSCLCCSSIVQFCTILLFQHSTVLYYTFLHSTVLYCIVVPAQHSSVLYCSCTVQFCTILLFRVQYSFVLYCCSSTVQFCIILSCTVQFCTILLSQHSSVLYYVVVQAQYSSVLYCCSYTVQFYYTAVSLSCAITCWNFSIAAKTNINSKFPKHTDHISFKTFLNVSTNGWNI